MTPEDLRLISLFQQQNRKIVFTNGVFDLLHAGHVEFLGLARDLGDVLVVAVDTDDSVRRLKGVKRPIIPENERLNIVRALTFTSCAFLFEGGEEALSRCIRQICPAIYAKGNDYRDHTPPCMEALREVGSQWISIPLHSGTGRPSTSIIIDRVIHRYAS